MIHDGILCAFQSWASDGHGCICHGCTLTAPVRYRTPLPVPRARPTPRAMPLALGIPRPRPAAGAPVPLARPRGAGVLRAAVLFPLGVPYFELALDETGGFSTNDVSLVL